ncbi:MULTISPECIES: amidohydrolase [Streptosporangium]|uniref:Amidohydrolase YtcJ n=1 Tax=Streptosporangium brasiliense TaxID=47480 RepID=A0ABT9RD59_9ACTN|nr:amidohydrolase [Streptosporangium brasiliense]MDP9867189.1 putative amidohydrolase YtcJ [Streptosporangium brasiliense]
MPAPADLVFHNGPVHTLGPARTAATAVAVRDGLIVAVGRDADVRPLIGAATEVVDLAGRALLPGFQDAHVHPVLAGATMIQCDLHDARDADEALAAVRTYAAANPEAEWIAGGGWSMEWFSGGTPSRHLLDAVVPDRPVHLINQDGHGAWVNTRALERCGIDAGTPDPIDGRIEREADGTPQGTLHEGASDLVARHVPEPTADMMLRALRAGQRRMHSVGVTAWQDAMVSPEVQRAYLTAAESGLLTARVVGALWWDRERGEEQIPELLARRGGAGRFRATSVKIMQDGVAENFTAAMTSPYLDGCGCRTGNQGLSFLDPERLRAHVTRLDAEGFQVHVHAVGDRAAREALDAFAAARAANGVNDHRHHIAHLQVVHPADVPRFAALGIAANVQPLWAAHEPQMDELTIPFLGPERAGWQYPFGDLARTGARLAAGSDWPVSSPDPFWGIHVAVNRTAPGGDREAFLPRQRLDLTAALAAYTIGTAWVNHLDTRTGTIEEGKLADLVVTDRDPCSIPAGELAETSVLATYVEGSRVHTDPAF